MTIAEVGKKFELSNDTLRYYERIGLIPKVGRTPKGIRNYTDDDCRWIEFIRCMRNVGLPIDVLVEYVALFQQGNKTHEVRKSILIEQRAQLAKRFEEMQRMLIRLDEKIERYEKWSVPIESDLKIQTKERE